MCICICTHTTYIMNLCRILGAGPTRGPHRCPPPDGGKCGLREGGRGVSAGLGFRVQLVLGLGFRVQQVQGFGVLGLGFFRVWGFLGFGGAWGLRGVRGSGDTRGFVMDAGVDPKSPGCAGLWEILWGLKGFVSAVSGAFQRSLAHAL